VQRALVPKKLQSESYCPTCAGALVCDKTADPFATCLCCPASHRFFVMPKSSNCIETAKAGSAHFPELEHGSINQIAAFWLTEPTARIILTEQLAKLLRVILEDRFASDKAFPFTHCLVCGKRLYNLEVPDDWMMGLRCPDGHTWWSRGDTIGGIVDGTEYTLCAELSEFEARQLVSAWLGRNADLDSNLHQSVRQVLEHFMLKGE
jgi:hypothetical protein